MGDQYLKTAKEIVKKHSLSGYIDALLNHWEENPTTLGHGFGHVLEVAVCAYEISELNKYSDPAELFVAGLFHDIYRPARGEGGNEDHHEESAKIIKDLLAKLDPEAKITNKIAAALISHDEWYKEKNPPEFDLYLSYGDKSAHDVLMTDAYAWASNKYAMAEKGKPHYKVPLDTLGEYAIYQSRAWKVFLMQRIKGSEKAIAVYLEVYKQIASKYQEGWDQEKYLAYLQAQAERFVAKEEEYLKAFGRSAESIKKITSGFYD